MPTDMFANTNRKGWRAAPLAWLQSPGFAVITCWRLAHRLNRKGPLLRLLSAIIWRYGVARHGCYISLNAQIGPRLRLPHATGIVIGDGARIGSDVTIYQHVTLGRADDRTDGYPWVGDGCCLYAGAVIVGNVHLGDRAIVGANSVVLSDVPQGATVVGSPARPVINERT